MMQLWHDAVTLYEAAVRGAAQPWVICIVLILITFVLEDLAIAVAAVLAVQGLLSWELAVLAVAAGIALGDLGLYGLGVAANRVPALRRRLIDGEGRRGDITGRQVERHGVVGAGGRDVRVVGQVDDAAEQSGRIGGVADHRGGDGGVVAHPGGAVPVVVLAQVGDGVLGHPG